MNWTGLFYFLIWPFLAGTLVLWSSWRHDHLKFGTSLLIGLGVTAGVLALGLAVTVF